MTRAAELVLTGGRVATMDPAHPVTDAVAVRGGRIAALGSAAAELRGPATEVVDLRGRLLLPGFHDAHAHPVYGGLERLRCDLTASTSAADCLRRIGAHRAAHPSGWLLGGGWDMGLFPGGTPSREALDAVTGTQPAYLVNRDHHGAWVNSAALRAAGIDADTPDPPDGRIERAADGSPAGMLHEGATGLVARVLPPAGREEYLAGLLEGQRHLLERGVTMWHDAIVGPYLGYADTLEVYRDADRRGLLTARVRGALWWDRERGVEQLPELRERRDRSRGEKFTAEAVKIMQDGVCESLTAALLQPYLDTAPAGRHRGLSFLTAPELREAVVALDAAGFDVHFHAVGDRAVRDALDAVAASGRRGRHQIAHVQVVHPDDVPRFGALGVTATIQPLWAINDAAMTELTVPRLGRPRADGQYPFRALRDAGADLAVGSDWPVSEADPVRAAHVAVHRREPGSEVPAFLPEQRLDLPAALAASTAGSARVNRLEHESGTLAVGMAADLVVLDRDPFALAADEIGDCAVDLTVVGGRIAHQR
ncbi:amidohydrolase [Saccharopolyspora cebuensis]|uniref:Amidohydrolase n=1 Tax=Saccharopolyspora cebuensis TaxID=418759 RepID=A0ABV4CDK4_9PSEU